MKLKVAGIDLLSCLNQTTDKLGLKMEPCKAPFLI
jgi:hypothetical protein